MMLKYLLATPLVVMFGSAEAATLSHDANDFAGALSPPYGALVEAVGPSYINAGVDYSFGNREGVFNDGDALAICGINLSDLCDLVTTVDARIVVANSGMPGLTSRIFVEAGFAEAEALSLNVFDRFFNLLATATNSLDSLAPNGRSRFGIDRGGRFDIAYFSISGDDDWGLNFVEITDPVAVSPIPLPAAGWMMLAGLAGLARLARRRANGSQPSEVTLDI